ncbi:hypothetical protein GDO78_008998 [Eleutherodactylus coqui]|nr:hypothetical protein GDO78_008998 [Eleutherodactylus coqui]
MAEEDEEIDLYNEVTFGLDHEESDEEPLKEEVMVEPSEQKPEMVREVEDIENISEIQPEEIPDLDDDTQDVEALVGSMKEANLSVEQEGPAESSRTENVVLGDPAVMKAVHGQPTLESPGFMSPTPFRPMSPNISTPIRPMTPKMVRMHFGPMSPSPSLSPFFSPMANTLQRFKVPGHVTQLHPQHRRILSQRQRPQSTTRKQWDNRADPYASLMSLKEKEWVIKLQMIQLQSENPHLDDYYYQTYYEKMERRLAEEELLGERKKKEPPKLVTPYIQKTETYESVVHIEGSLGQVAVSTCYSPRRAIDAIAYVMPGEDMKPLGYQRLRVLKHIEKLFVLLLEVEEMQRKMPHIPEDQHILFQHKQRYKVQRICEDLKIGACCCEEESEDEFLQLLQVGKGTKLTARLLPFLHSEQAIEILLTVVQHLSFLIKNDTTEKSLSVLYGPLTSIINGLPFTELIRVIQELTKTLPETPDLPLTLAFQNQFGISLLYALLSHGESLLSSDTPMEPCIGDFEKWTDTVFLVARELSHVSKSSMVEPLFLPSNLLSLFCRYLDKQTIHKLEDKME